MAGIRDRLRAAARPQPAGGATAVGPTATTALPAYTAGNGERPAVVVRPWPADVPEAVLPPGQPWAVAPVGDGRRLSSIALRRERRSLARRYDELQRDVGGLAIEMARQANFNYPLLRARSEEALRVEARVAAIDHWLATAVDRRRAEHARRRAERVAPLEAAAPTAPLPALPAPSTLCPRCRSQIPADANFCGYCGAVTSP